MAQLMEGNSGSLYRGLMANAPGLPPRFPSIHTNRGALLSDLDNILYSNQDSSANANRNHRQHRHTPSCLDQAPWLDKLPEQQGPLSKSSHRRSTSDSFTYLENSASAAMFSNIVKADESLCQSSLVTKKPTNQDKEDGDQLTVCQSSLVTGKATNKDKEDGDQLTDLLEEIQQLQDQQNIPISVRAQQQAANSSSVNTTEASQVAMGARQFALELKGVNDGEFYGLWDDSNNGHLMSVMDQAEDPKKPKRVLANRQSAQRSRVRKLQYIAELESIVNSLQMEVSSLSLQVLYLKHRRALLNMDNNALEQQAVFFVQEKQNKDSQNEILMHDIRRLQKLGEFQTQQQQQPSQVQQLHQQRSSIQRHSSLPSDFVVPMMHQSGEQLLQPSSANSISGMMRDFTGMSLDAALRREKLRSDDDVLSAEAGHAMDVNRAGRTGIVRRKDLVGHVEDET